VERFITKTVTQRVTIAIPDEYSSDETMRGRFVDVILRQSHDQERKGGRFWPRTMIWDEDDAVVQAGIAALNSAYALADALLQLRDLYD
jgi:hypothetical protein